MPVPITSASFPNVTNPQAGLLPTKRRKRYAVQRKKKKKKKKEEVRRVHYDRRFG